ncbi:MAG: helix-turn-helix domain-containing protein [Alphaproteobacteria bacterium]|nr:helix-turn-helix domain-containing protein [Alphaproteobacteria bacterium]
MFALLDQGGGPFVANEAEATIARNAAEKLAAVANTKQDIKIIVQDDPKVVVPLPARAVALIMTVLTQMANRAPFSVIPYQAELTTQQAADYLNVSRPHLTRLIDEGKIGHRMVGRHRRVKFGDLIKFENESREERKKALAELAAEQRRLNLE